MRSVALAICFALGLVVRLAIWTGTGALGPKITDEQQYTQIAENIRAGNGFAWAPGQPTSIRPPLYPGLLAATWTLPVARPLVVANVGLFVPSKKEREYRSP